MRNQRNSFNPLTSLVNTFTRMITGGGNTCQTSVIRANNRVAAPQALAQVEANLATTDSDMPCNSEAFQNIETNNNNVEAPKKRVRRCDNGINLKNILPNADQPLIGRLRTRRATGYDKNGHATDHAQYNRITVNGTKRFEKADKPVEKHVAISSRRKRKTP